MLSKCFTEFRFRSYLPRVNNIKEFCFSKLRECMIYWNIFLWYFIFHNFCYFMTVLYVLKLFDFLLQDPMCHFWQCRRLALYPFEYDWNFFCCIPRGLVWFNAKIHCLILWSVLLFSMKFYIIIFFHCKNNN